MGPNWPKIMSGKEHLVSCKISCVKFRAIFEKQFFYFFLKPTGHTVSATFFDDGSIKRRNVGSVTRWLDYYSIFGHLHRWKFAQRHTIFAKVGSKCCQIVKNHKTCPRLWGFCQIFITVARKKSSQSSLCLRKCNVWKQPKNEQVSGLRL